MQQKQKGSTVVGLLIVLVTVIVGSVWWWQKGNVPQGIQIPTTQTATSTARSSDWIIATATSTYEQSYPEGVCRFLRKQTEAPSIGDKEHLIGECHLSVATSTSPIRFELYANDRDALVRVHVEKSNGMTQDIDTSEEVTEKQNGPEDTFVLMDINFDGYKDIRFGNWFGNRGDVGYGFRIYDPATESFVRDERFLEFENPVIDSQSRCIHESHTYLYPADYTVSTCLRGDQMILMEREQRKSAGDGTDCYSVTKELRQPDGSMKSEVSQECDRG